MSVSCGLQTLMSYVDLLRMYYAIMSEHWVEKNQTRKQAIIFNTQNYLDFLCGRVEAISKLCLLHHWASISSSASPGRLAHPGSWLCTHILKQPFWCCGSFALQIGFWWFHIGNWSMEGNGMYTWLKWRDTYRQESCDTSWDNLNGRTVNAWQPAK